MGEIAEPSVASQQDTQLPRRRGAMAFADLVNLRFRDHTDEQWERELDRFQNGEGRLVDSYWCEQAPSAVALTEVRPNILLRLFLLRDSETRLHRRTENLVAHRPEFASLLLAIDQQSIRVSNVLSG